MVQRSSVRYIHIAPAPGNVQPVSVASIIVTPPGAPTTSIPALLTLQLAATAYDFFGHLLSSAGLLWSSSNTGVATVSASGLVTGVAMGTATISASFGGVIGSITLTVTQPQDSSLADVRAAFGGDSDIIGAYDSSAAAVSVSVGKVVSENDARGSSYGPPLIGFGSPLPTYNAGPNPSITTDGVQNYLAAVLDGRFTLSGARWIAWIGTVQSQFPASIQPSALGAPFLVIGGDPIKALSPATGPSSTIAASATPRLIIAQVSTPIGGPSTLMPWVSLEVAGDLRQVQWENGALVSGSNIFTNGHTPGNSNYALSTRYAAFVGKGRLTLARIQALQRYAIGRGAVLAAPAATKDLIGIGDSIMFGTNASDPLTTGWFPQAVAGLPGYRGMNGGHASLRAWEIVQDLDTFLLAAINPLRTKHIVPVHIGTNDIALDNASAAFVQSQLNIIGDAVLQAGGQPVFLNMLNRVGLTAAQITERLALNVSIPQMVAAGKATKTSDVASVVDPTVSGDGTHPNDPGYVSMKTKFLADTASIA